MSSNQKPRINAIEQLNKIKENGGVMPNGSTLVEYRPLSSPADYYLAYILCKKNDEWITWLYNATSKGCLLGHYYNTEQAARNDFLSRGI